MHQIKGGRAGKKISVVLGRQSDRAELRLDARLRVRPMPADQTTSESPLRPVALLSLPPLRLALRLKPLLDPTNRLCCRPFLSTAHPRTRQAGKGQKKAKAPSRPGNDLIWSSRCAEPRIVIIPSASGRRMKLTIKKQAQAHTNTDEVHQVLLPTGYSDGMVEAADAALLSPLGIAEPPLH